MHTSHKYEQNILTTDFQDNGISVEVIMDWIEDCHYVQILFSIYIFPV